MKIILQDLRKLKLAWDDPVPDHIAKMWKNWRSELPLITSRPIPRYHLLKGKEVISLQLHGVSDASKSAYAGVIYLRAIYSDTTVSTSLLFAKAKVAPLNGCTIPRKKLNGAQLLSKILLIVANTLSISLADVFAWCDSTIVLCWLPIRAAKLKTYVCNRVMDTISHIPATHWRYVPTECNPADIASRGAIPSRLISFELWWNGPTWLLQPPSAWPASTDWRNQKDLSETKPVVLLTVTPLENFTELFSSYTKLKRVMTWCLCFICNCKSIQKDRLASSHLSLDELQIADTKLLKLSQSHHHPHAYLLGHSRAHWYCLTSICAATCRHNKVRKSVLPESPWLPPELQLLSGSLQHRSWTQFWLLWDTDFHGPWPLDAVPE